ncbi:sulfur carrier protein ThiS [Ectothiorhodospiraceae bacterium WFHF3C12]|nr:sulfur carrier protein ThiS [Ectothiorhodospiraceae bacterium WFHF3C12]
MIEIIVNGEPRQFGEGITAAELVEELDLAGKRLAMEVNEELLPRSEFPGYRLSPGDQVEIVVAIGGG